MISSYSFAVNTHTYIYRHIYTTLALQYLHSHNHLSVFVCAVPSTFHLFIDLPLIFLFIRGLDR